jgi:hypothetical protein
VRVAAGRPATLRQHISDEAGGDLAIDGGSHVFVTVVAGDGVTAVLAAVQATQVGSTAVYTVVLPAQAKLDRLTATWTATVAATPYTWTVIVDVIAERLMEPWRLRQDSTIAALDPDTFLTTLDQIEEFIRDFAGFPAVAEGLRTSFDESRGALGDTTFQIGTINGLPYGGGGGLLLVPGVRKPGQVYAGSINGAALDPVNDVPKISTQDGCLVWSDWRPWQSGRYSLWLTHGDPNPPREIRAVVAKLMKFAATPNNYPLRASQVLTEGATIMFAGTGPDRPTGIPDIDATLVRYRVQSVI